MTAVTARMYCGLLGDCFLIRVFDDAGADRTRQADAHILIDCGILQRVADERSRIRAVAENIRATCGGTLDLVVVTHEHHDHLCGFGHADDIFLDPAGITIEQLWLGWTEKEGDTQADTMRGQFKQARLGIAGAAQRLRLGIGNTDRDDIDQDDAKAWKSDGALDGLERFLGPVEGLLGVSKRRTGREILRDLKAKAKTVECHEPGAIAGVPGGLKAYVLGPPRDPGYLLEKDIPSKDASKETYLAIQAGLGAAGHATGFGNIGADGRLEASLPFDKRHNRFRDTDVLERMQAPTANAADTHRDFWAVREIYTEKPDRRIDRAWEGPIGSLALKLDRATNNTSLVLAIETVPGGPIMLFAADAQVGNWLSWEKLAFPDGPGGALSSADLLARTTLYKVGHHGSHNATLKKKGLKQMTHPDLVAMISVVEDEARMRPGWEMPYEPMLEDLTLATGERILRGDAAVPVGKKFSDGTAFESRVRTFRQPGKAANLWVEFDVC